MFKLEQWNIISKQPCQERNASRPTSPSGSSDGISGSSSGSATLMKFIRRWGQKSDPSSAIMEQLTSPLHQPGQLR